MEKADHSGHRGRLREKYLNHGIEALAPHEVLELMLYYAIPYRNTNDIAKNLIDSYGSLSNVLDAPVDMLVRSGLTSNQAVFLKLIPDITRVYMTDKYDNPDKVIDIDRLAELMIDKFIGREHDEQVMMMLLDSKGKEVFCGVIARGEFNNANIQVRNVIKLAVNYNAAAVVFAHNHPSGNAMPSSEDYRTTLELKRALGMVGVYLLDHYVVADHDCVSMAQTGLLNDE